jgi:ABC-type nitrate/sulfonate/bicarbonate transport system substrate-binding protein
MELKVRTRLIIVAMALWACGQFAMAKQSAAQERIKIAYSADNSTNVIWYSALDTGIYKKYGLDVELIFIPSSTTTVFERGSGRHSGREHLRRCGGKRRGAGQT